MLDKLFGVSVLPIYILIDNKGKLIAYHSVPGAAVANFGGKLRGEDLDKTLNSVIGTSR